MARKRIPTPLRTAVVDANAGVCCVCKTRGVGVEIHHLDHDPGNNVASNLAVLCVRHHDAHHRPGRYQALMHLEQGTAKIREFKRRWEAAVADTRQPEPSLLAALNVYGSEKEIHSMRLIVQRIDGTVELERLYHLTSAPIDDLTYKIMNELEWLSPSLTMAMIDGLLPIDHCPCCKSSLANVIDSGRALKLTSPHWGTNSHCSVYVNPRQASLCVLISHDQQTCDSITLHRCGDSLHVVTPKSNYRVPIQQRPSVRAQAAALVQDYIRDWDPAHLLIGTGIEDDPTLIETLTLPRCWERRADANDTL